MLADEAPPITRPMNRQARFGAQAVLRKLMHMPAIEYSSTGRRPTRSLSAPTIGMNRNCISPNTAHHAVPQRLLLAPVHEFADQGRQHRHDQADAEHVDEDADQDEVQVAGRGRMRGRCSRDSWDTGHGMTRGRW
jgi:hypothetical protein